MATIKAFKTAPTQITNVYTYTFTEKDIRRSDGYRLVISRGVLIPAFFVDVHRVLYACNLIRSGLTVEAQSVARGPRSRVKPTVVEDGVDIAALSDVVEMIEKELNIITGDGAAWQQPTFRFRAYADRISHLLNDLHSGNWYGSPNPKRTQGVASIETIGDRLFGLLLDLFWEMDNTISTDVHASESMPQDNSAAAGTETSPSRKRAAPSGKGPHALTVLASEEELEEELGGLMGKDDLTGVSELREFDGDFDRYSEPL